MFEKRLYYHIDWAMLAAILALCLIGVVQIYSATASSGQTLHVTQTIPLAKSRPPLTIPLGKSPPPGEYFGLATGDGAVWVTDNDQGTLLRIDPATGVIVSTIRVGGHPRGIAVGAGRIWVSLDEY